MKLKDTILEIQEENEFLEGRVQSLEDENKTLKARNEFLQRMCNGLKLNNSQLTIERNKLCEKLHSLGGA